MKAANPPIRLFNLPRSFNPLRRARSLARRAALACALLACALSILPLNGVAAAAGGKGARKAAPKAAQAKMKAAQAKPSPSPVADASKKPVGIDIESQEVYPYPSDGGLKKYALVVKKKESEFQFDGDPRLVSLSLTPAGATDITVRRVTPTRIEADFWAPAEFKVKDVNVSVNAYDRDNPRLVVASSDVKAEEDAGGNSSGMTAAARKLTAKEKEDAVQPEIDSTVIVFLQRAYGIGRLKIEGKNFGNQPAPPIPAEDYLLCYEQLARQAIIEPLSDRPKPTADHPFGAKAQQQVEDSRCAYLKDTNKLADWEKWRADVERSVKVALVPRNTDLRIEQTKILYMDDKLIDVYFEFNRYYRNSEPLRLASTTVTIRKSEGAPTKPDAKAGAKSLTASNGSGARRAGDAILVNASASVGADGAEEAKPAPLAAPGEMKTYIATKEVGTKQDENLEYRYTVLDNGSATTLFGKGVANNFYVIQLSVTNKGEKKVAVPLASVQAEIEWAYGPNDDKTNAGGQKSKSKSVAVGERAGVQGDAAESPLNRKAKEIPASSEPTTDYYEEGPATLAPLPLAAVTAFFDGDEKVNGKKARFFNVTDGLATLGSSLIPFFGPGFRDAHVAFTGGLVPGIRRGLGDLSSQQLQNLTAMSWQGIEVVAAGGGTVEKFVFIQRGDQLFSPGFGERLRKTIKNIEGMEVVGFEVKEEGEGKRAIPADQQ